MKAKHLIYVKRNRVRGAGSLFQYHFKCEFAYNYFDQPFYVAKK